MPSCRNRYIRELKQTRRQRDDDGCYYNRAYEMKEKKLIIKNHTGVSGAVFGRRRVAVPHTEVPYYMHGHNFIDVAEQF